MVRSQMFESNEEEVSKYCEKCGLPEMGMDHSKCPIISSTTPTEEEKKKDYNNTRCDTYGGCTIPDCKNYIPSQSDSGWEKEFDEQFNFAVKYKSSDKKTDIVDFDYHAKERDMVKVFIKSLLSKDREVLKGRIDSMRKRTVSKEHYPQITDNKIKEREVYNQALEDVIKIIIDTQE